jgi:hypothetical protein
MTKNREIDPTKSVRDVIVDLLLATLPPEMKSAAPDLAERVGEHPDVAPHFCKRWGDLFEGEGNVIAREVGVVAHDVSAGAAGATDEGERLH